MQECEPSTDRHSGGFRITSRKCMKILYLGDERDARAAAEAFRAISLNARVLWAPDPAGAEAWIHDHTNAAAVVLEIQHDSQGSFFLRRVRRLGLNAPVVVVVPDGSGTPRESLDAGADDYVTKTPSLSHQLPLVVRRAIERTQMSGPLADLAAAARQRASTWAVERTAVAERQNTSDEVPALAGEVRRSLEQQLARANAALEEAEQRHIAALSTAAAKAAEREARHEIALSKAAVVRDMVDEQLRVAAAQVAEARQKEMAAAGEVERLSQRESELTTLLAGEAAARAALERRVAEGEAALVALGETLGQQARDLETALDQARQTLTSSAATIEQLIRRETDLTAMLSAEAAERATLERRLAQTEATLKDAVDRATRDELAAAKAAAERQVEFDGTIDRERTIRAEVEEQLANVETALREAEQQRRRAEAAAASRLAQREGELSQTTASRDQLKQQLSDVEALVAGARRDYATAAAEVERLTHRETELTARLRTEVGARAALDRRLAETETTLKEAEDRATRDRLDAAEAAAERQAAFDALLDQERASRTRFERELSEVETNLTAARRELAAAAADVERLAAREIELTAIVTVGAAERATLEQRLADTEATLKDTEDQATRDQLAATKTAAARQAEFDAAIDRERDARGRAERKLADVEAALRTAQDEHQSAMAVASTRMAERAAQFERELSEMAAERDRIRQQLNDVEIALTGERRDHAASAAEVDRLAARETELTGMVAAGAAERVTLEQRLAETEASLKHAENAATRDRLAAAEAAAERQAEFDGTIDRERDARARVERQLASVETALREAEQQHRWAMASATSRLAQREAQFENELSQTTASRDQFKQQLSAVELLLADARRDHSMAAADVERLVARETELTATVAAAAAERAALEQRLADTRSTLKNTEDAAAGDRLAAAQAAAERQAEFDGRLGQEHTLRNQVEQRLADVETALREAEQQHRRAMATAASRLAQREGQLEGELSQTTASRDQFKQRLSDVEALLANARRDHGAAVTEIERLTQSEATLVASLSERDAQIEAQAAQHSASLAAAERERVNLRRDLESTLAARALQIAHLNETLQAVTGELVATRKRGEILHAEAARVPQLLQQLEELQAELRVRFERSPHALCRCTPAGTIRDANRTFAALLGNRRPDELHGADFAATAFESPEDLTWLIERSLRTQATVSTETTWRRKNGDRFPVRVSAFASASGFIEIAADDLTSMRALEERLSQAQHMESVGRLASEVAVTCNKLLAHVHRDAREWLTAVAGDARAQHRGEILLDDVTRATGHLQRLVDYSDEQDSALAPVDLHKVLRNLKPVLKHVAGDDVIVELPKRSSPLTVDLMVERVERLLVNLASYGRERMPFGGRLKIELGTVVVGRKFLARYPNVRQGPHALITVTEVRRTQEDEQVAPLRQRTTAGNSGERAAGALGVDLGTVQELIQECGGHLWMTAERSGNMIVKMRLPLRAWYRDAKRADVRVSAVPGPWAAL
jgi:PAS domain S-box-containing protein